MFYTHAILTKRGPLARLWLAAHWDKKLTKAQIFETDIRLSCESILEPCLKLALRTKGHLLLGVVRIYSRKTKYLLADCNEAFIKIKMAFRTGLAPSEGTSNHHNNQNLENREACIAAITLPDNFHDFDMIDLNLDYIDDPSRFYVHQARTEEITLKEDCINEPMPIDDDFGDVNALDEPEFFRKLQTSSRNRNQNSIANINNTNVQKDQSLAQPMSDDPFALDGFDDPMGPPSVIAIANDQSNLSHVRDQLDHVMSPFQQDDNPSVLPLLDSSKGPTVPVEGENQMDIDTTHQDIPNNLGTDDTTLLSNVSDEYILPPIATTGQTPAATRQAAAKRKRKLVIDEVKEMDSGMMKIQMNDTKDIVGVLELAPPTRRLMYLKETGALDKLFLNTATSIYSKALQQFMTSQMITKPIEQMSYSYYQNQYDIQMEQSDFEQESSIDQMRAAPHDYLDAINPDPSLNLSKKRALSPMLPNESNLDKRPRLESMLPTDSLVLPPMMSMDNLIDAVFDPLSTTTTNSRPLQELNRMSPTLGDTHMRRKKTLTNMNKENQENTSDEDDNENDQTTRTQEDGESEKRLTRRAKAMLNIFEHGFNSTGTLSFHDHLLTKTSDKQSRKLTAQNFYTLLVLKKLQAVNVQQEVAYGDIMVKPGAHFHDYIIDDAK